MSAPEPNRRPDPTAYLRFTGMGLTMMGIILAFTFAGHWFRWRSMKATTMPWPTAG